ncbi:hypothetical protein R3W88_029557 [Solanum pinnatisectum]|uniref:Uncharacterized protein n=1 Tax=Solanum pinnatisectum TaxID=50273 RepID=A0AAV9K5V7_9SOLN|nr:hypothetical protein R3W88_029557 [Solanum pinnatisectum]
MAPRLKIEGKTTDTPDWTCKVQIEDMSRDILSLKRKIQFKNLILVDEQEQQMRATVYGDDIDYYAGKLILLDTYLISTARVKVSLPSYGRIIHKFYWVLYKETLIEHIKPNNELEKSLHRPNIVGVVLRCGPSKYVGRTQNRCQIERAQLEDQMKKGKEFPVILGRNIGIFDLSLQTRFNSAIRINPTYPQALQLISWC